MFTRLSLFCIAVAMTSYVNHSAADEKLSREGQNQKPIHDYLFNTFVQGRETSYVGSGRDRGLKEITLLKETKELRHGDEVLLPEGAERVAGLFRHFAFHGANLDRVKEVYVLPFSPDKSPPRSEQVKDFYRVQMPSIPLSSQPPERTRIILPNGGGCRVRLRFIRKRNSA